MRRALVCAVLLAAVAGGAQTLAPGPFIDARLTRVSGAVTVAVAGADGPPATAAAGVPLDAGDVIAVGAGASAELAMDGDSVIELEPNTKLTVSSLARRECSLSIALGAIIAKVKHAMLDGGSLTVHTQTAVAAVRGTEFAVDAGEGGVLTHVAVFDEGRVSVTDPGGRGEVFLEPRHETSVMRGESPVAAHALRRFAAWRARLARLRQRVKTVGGAWKPLPASVRERLRHELADGGRIDFRRARAHRARARAASQEAQKKEKAAAHEDQTRAHEEEKTDERREDARPR